MARRENRERERKRKERGKKDETLEIKRKRQLGQGREMIASDRKELWVGGAWG